MPRLLMRLFAVCAALSMIGMVGVSVDAQTKSKGKSAPKKTTQTAAKKSEVLYECQHCKQPMSLAAAKKLGMECCGMKMVPVKTAKKAAPQKKS